MVVLPEGHSGHSNKHDHVLRLQGGVVVVLMAITTNDLPETPHWTWTRIGPTYSPCFSHSATNYDGPTDETAKPEAPCLSSRGGPVPPPTP